MQILHPLFLVGVIYVNPFPPLNYKLSEGKHFHSACPKNKTEKKTKTTLFIATYLYFIYNMAVQFVIDHT